jgi:spore germination protein GerM
MRCDEASQKKHSLQKKIEQDVKPKRAQTFKSTTDALSSLINGPKSDGKAKGGEGTMFPVIREV